LNYFNLESLSPRLILNLDEIGFGAFKTGRVKALTAVIPATSLARRFQTSACFAFYHGTLRDFDSE
jgi:hypothetical protein